MNTKRWTAMFAAAAMTVAACSGGGDKDGQTSTTTTPDGATNTPVVGGGTGGSGSGSDAVATGPGNGLLGITLSEGQAVDVEAQPLAVVDGQPLTDAEIAAVLDRLPEWELPADDVSEFNRPVDSLTPPVVGETIDAPFPPDVAGPTPPDAVADGPLEVIRFQPDGEVGVAPFIALSFNEPMVALATLEQLDDADVPVTISPDLAAAGVDGRWRWIGTKTLRFEVLPTTAEDGGVDRLPAATEYTVTVPAGTESVNGAVLGDAVEFTFATPAARATAISGVSDSMVLDPIFVAMFDQRVDPDAVIETISFEAGDVTSVRLATDAEIDDRGARRLIDAALPDRAFAFVPSATLDPDTRVEVTVGPNVPSLEGPRTTEESLTESGRTFAPLKVERTDCYDTCPPFASFDITFNNLLDRAAFDPTWITVEPAVPGLRVDVFGTTLSIRGSTAGNTTYTVTIAADLLDVHGQTLGEDYTHEFDVGDARPFFFGPDRETVTTDPFAEQPGVSFTSVNHDELKVTAWQVAPDEFDEYQRYLEETYSDTRPAEPDWPIVLDTIVDVDADTDEVAETVVDLTAAFEASNGPIVLRVEPDPPFDPRDDEYWQNRPSYSWVQATTLGVDAFTSNTELVAWVTDLLTGDPVAGADIELLGTQNTVTTDADGLVRLDLTATPILGLTATSDGRSATLPAGRFTSWQSSPSFAQARWYVIDDRGVYRPGETARLTGLVRELTAADAQLALIAGDLSVDYTAYDGQGNDIATGSVPVNAIGGFNASIDVPEAANTGYGYIEFVLVNGDVVTDYRWGHEYQIEDFRTPDYEVQARAESEGPYYVVEPATIGVDASYFAGGPLADAEVNWFVSTSQTSYAPPNWNDFDFGIWTPWWYSGYEDRYSSTDDYYYEDFGGPGGGPTTYQEYVGRTDAAGTHLLQIDFADAAANDDENGPAVDQPSTVTAEATVFDVNRQAISSRTDLLVHPAQYYVGLRTDRSYVELGDPIRIDTTVVDVDGNLVAGRDFEVTAGRLDYTYGPDGYVEELVDVQTCDVTSTDAVTNESPDESMRCEFATDVGGQYRITAIVTDDDGRQNRSERTQWVSGSTGVPTRGLERGEVIVVPDAENYAPGDTAELLVQAPFAPASGLVTVSRAGIESVEAFDAPDGSAVITVPIAADDVPDLRVRIDMVGTSARTNDDGTPAPDAPLQPAFAVGEITLPIPPIERTLGVTATPDSDELIPGESTSVTVAVTGADGAPVEGAGVAVIVVDEAVLSLTGYQLDDPLAAFYGQIANGVGSTLLRDSVILVNPESFRDSGGANEPAATTAMSDEAESSGSDDSAADFEGGASAPAPDASTRSAGDGDAAGEAESPIDVRADFDALAVFAPDETTGADGTVSVDIDLPDNLTRYRVMAVGVDGVDRFGSGESMITARLPVSVRPSAPRFLNFGDRFELPVVVQNLTDAPVEVDVALETANLELTDGAGRRVTVPANDRIEVRFPAAAVDVGTARFRIASVGGEFTDAATVAMPVYTPATSEAFATYGVVDGSGVIGQPVLAPDGVFPQFGGLEISTSSTALQALTDSVLYLYEYRYDSADGYASRIMAVAALRDVLDAFDADGLPNAADLDAAVQRDITRLQALQNDDGGFPYWQRGRESIPWVSVQATHAQVLAQQNGYDVDQFKLDVSLDHLGDIEQYIPATYSQSTRDAISAYALYVRGVAADRDTAKALELYRRGVDSTLQLDSVAQLWTVIDDAGARTEIERLIENSAVETPNAATFATSYGEDAYLIAHSDRRTDGVVLGALVSESPDSDLIVKVVNGLLGNQTRGRWNNAQENSFILLSLNQYFDTFESVDPDFVARAWLGDAYAAEAEFRGRSTDTSLTTVPMTELIAAGDTDLVVANDGAGRLYYRLGLRYAPDDLDLDPRDEGFVVERTYEAVDDASDVQRDSDGTWRIAAGATVRVRLTMVADARRTHVALIDPLPAGLEPVNPALATSLTVGPDEGDGDGGEDGDFSRSYWWWQWFEHQNLRDDRAEAFTSYLSAGTYEYTYIARATTPGEFVVPPTRAEEIFAPEVFGRSSSDAVIVT